MTDQPARYHRTPADIEAVQWTGTNTDALRAFAGSDFDTIDPEDRIEDPDQDAQLLVEASHWVGIKAGDWVVKYEGYFVAKADATFRAVWEPAAVSVPPSADRTAWRDRIAEALYAHNHPGWATRYSDLDQDERDTYLARADAVLAVLPEQADRAAVLLEAADDLATAFGDPMAKHIGLLGAAHLRRRARAGQAAEAQPETPLEKRLRYSERRNDELRTECKRRGKTVLEHSEKNRALERQLDEVRRQLGAEILRANHAETELRRVAAEEQPAKPDRCPHGCDTSICPCLACEAAEEPESSCTCASAGNGFVPLGHYRDCPAASAEPHPTEADMRHALAVLDTFHGRDTAGPAVGEQPETQEADRA